MALTDFLKDIADAIRSAEGSSDEIHASDFAQRIALLGGGGGGESGVITPTSTSSSVEIPTSLTSINFIIFVRTTETNMENGDFALMLMSNVGGYAKTDTMYYGVAVKSSWGNVGAVQSSTKPFELSNGVVTINTSSFSGACNFTNGITYKYYLL